ncbi:hypothetical protein E4U44_005452 [Claviceps purpurea]|nr:hypothetical protein E4U44_005452 [Claviceps purpurea]
MAVTSARKLVPELYCHYRMSNEDPEARSSHSGSVSKPTCRIFSSVLAPTVLLYRQGIDGRPYRFSQAVTYPSKFTFLNRLANGQIDIESASLVVV